MPGRLGLLIIGPNASGKTATVARAMSAYAFDSRVRVVHADKELGGPKQGQVEALRRIWLSTYDVVVIEGIRVATVLRAAMDGDASKPLELLISATSAETMQEHIRRRCARVGKRFRDDYWTIEECGAVRHNKRHQREARELFQGRRVDLFEIDANYGGCSEMADEIQRRVSACLAN